MSKPYLQLTSEVGWEQACGTDVRWIVSELSLIVGNSVGVQLSFSFLLDVYVLDTPMCLVGSAWWLLYPVTLGQSPCLWGPMFPLPAAIVWWEHEWPQTCQPPICFICRLIF